MAMCGFRKSRTQLLCAGGGGGGGQEGLGSGGGGGVAEGSQAQSPGRRVVPGNSRPT